MNWQKWFIVTGTVAKMDRYIRQTRLPEIGSAGQKRLARSRVVMVGCGALGTAATLYLAGAGVGTLVVIDHDTVDLSNLQRQPAFTEGNVGQLKARVLGERLAALNSEVTIDTIVTRVSDDNFAEMTDGADILVEGTDNPSTKFLLTSLCEQYSLPYVIGGVNGFQGQAMSWQPGTTPYRAVFPPVDGDMQYSPPPVFGPVPGIVGCVQAAEVIKYLSGEGFALTDRMWLADTLKMTFNTISLV